VTRPAWAGQAADKLGSEKQEQSKAPEPWTASQTEQPASLAKELANSKEKKPLVVCAGFRDRYEKGHIPGAAFYGPASTEKGLEDLKKWAQDVPHTQAVVIYCGCCPMTQCPNVRPAFKALQEMGFKEVRVLVIKKDFPTNWVAQGYPDSARQVRCWARSRP
jgi:3-mercaptopyruvate sulfurtransferase SseA